MWGNIGGIRLKSCSLLFKEIRDMPKLLAELFNVFPITSTDRQTILGSVIGT